jgi:hypothetical protein
MIKEMTKEELKDYLIDLKSIVRREKMILIVNSLSLICGSYIDIDLFLHSDLDISYNAFLTFIIISLSLNFDFINDERKKDTKLLKKVIGEFNK